MGNEFSSQEGKKICCIVSENNCLPSCRFIDMYYDYLFGKETQFNIIEISCDEYVKLMGDSTCIEISGEVSLCPLLAHIYRSEKII